MPQRRGGFAVSKVGDAIYLLGGYADGFELNRVEPSPATHAIWTQLEAGETVYQDGELPNYNTLEDVHTLRTTQNTPKASV